jgi:hypothetical protein
MNCLMEVVPGNPSCIPSSHMRQEGVTSLISDSVFFGNGAGDIDHG